MLCGRTSVGLSLAVTTAASMTAAMPTVASTSHAQGNSHYEVIIDGS